MTTAASHTPPLEHNGPSGATPQAQAGSTQKKTKGKKAADPVNTSRAIEDTIAQLEKSRAVDKEQDAEIEKEVKRANRDLSQLLSKLGPQESKLDALQRKYTEMLAEMKRTERELVKTKKRADLLQKERDSNKSELNKVTVKKDGLEKLCRDFQKNSKRLEDENNNLKKTQAATQEELHKRLESMVEDVQQFIDLKEHPENQPEYLEQDELFRQKFRSFIDQYELREIQFYALLKTKELEVQHERALYEEQRKVAEHEALKSRQLTSQVSTFSQTEGELRSQLNNYVEKFKQVEDTLNNSNDLFLTFRKEMEEMSKKTKRLEKENNNLTRKHELTNRNILEMAEERTQNHKQLDDLLKKNEKLEKICRGMQEQGRGHTTTVLDGQPIGIESEDTEESDYEYSEVEEDEDEEDGSEEGPYEDFDEDPTHTPQQQANPLTAGPPPPPPPASNAVGPSGHGKVNGQANGAKH